MHLPTMVGAVQSCQVLFLRFHVLSWGFLWISGKAEDRSLQAGAGQKVLVASLAQRTRIAFSSSDCKLFSGKSLPNTKAAGRLGLLSLDLSSPIHEEGMCKRGSFTVHGGWGSPAPHLPSLALQVCLWAGEMNFSLAISTFRKHPVPSLSVYSGWGN